MEEEDAIEAFFKGKIVGMKAAKPSFSTVRCDVKKEESKFHRIVKENLNEIKVVEERKILTEFLNAPIEEIDDTLGIENCQEIQDVTVEYLQIYKKYEFNIPHQNLPILQKRNQIIQTIRANKVVILKADTGCGKSSQVPQYILEDCRRRNVQCNIVVTQPKKISAESLASRVAFERKCEVGSLVGYQIGMDKKLDTLDTKILYCTTGVFLQKLVHYKSLQKWTHIIIDEIHERDLDMDMVLLIIRRLMVATNSKAKIILMSATLNCDKIAEYFRLVQKPPIIDLNVPKPFPVRVHYLDELEHLGAKKKYIQMTEPAINKDMFRLGFDIIDFFVQKGASTFLVFLPGIFEIDNFKRELSIKRDKFDIKRFRVYILHSAMPVVNIKELYDTSITNKIVLATNIAESSITIPGIQIIIDYCLTKYLEVDSASSLTQLKLAWASKMNLEQRTGRTGRTNSGQIVRMLYKDQYETLPDEARAEMQRTSLENIILNIKNLQMGRPSDILAIALDPPKRSAIIDAMLLLKENGAMTRFNKKTNEFDFLDGHLTYTGFIMSKLPMDIRLSKLIVLGYVFSVLNECIIIAAGLSVGSIFRYEDSMNAYETKLNFETSSDLIAMMNAYFKYIDFVSNNRNNINTYAEEIWCKNNVLNFKNVKEMSKVIDEIKGRLKNFNILKDSFRYTTEEKLMVIKMCIAGAFYPSFYHFGGEIPGREEFKQTFNKNLCSTVYFQTKTPTKNGHLYEDQFQNLLFDSEIINCSEDAHITFDNNSQRIFVEFNNLRDDNDFKMPGDVKLEVYKAVKYRSLRNRNKLSILIMSPENEEIFAPSEERVDLYNKEFVSSELKLKAKFNIYPSFSIKPQHIPEYLSGEITHIISPSKFYFQPIKAKELLDKMKSKIGNNLKRIDNIDEKIDFNRIMVSYNNEFYRGQIIEFPLANDETYKVLLIDYGAIVKSIFEDLYTGCAVTRAQRQDLLQEFFKLPPMCYECKLAEIQPSTIQQYGWNKKTIEEFKEIIFDKIIQLDLYSFNVYDKIASVEIIARTRTTSPPINVGENLVHKGLAIYSNESYVAMISKTLNDSSEAMKYAIHKQHTPVDLPKNLLEIPCDLLGPFSPLEKAGRVEKVCRSEERDIQIDNSSINCALIDPYPYSGIKKLLVASSKSKTNRGTVTLRQTTMMPFIKGISTVLALTFSTFAEIRQNSDNTRITSVLAGLGCDFMKNAYYGEHDCLIRTDTEFDNEDIDMINKLRQEMSLLMQQNLNEKFEVQQNPMNVIQESRIRACSLLLKIIKKDRLELGVIYKDGFEWSGMIKRKMLEQNKMFPTHDAAKIKEIPRDKIKKMINHFRNLEQKARYNTKDEAVECMACEQSLDTLVDLRNHILKTKHVQLKTKYESLERDNKKY